mmetsp:Transcript_50742/g.142067  ORF Transcript_50742/g.142067 Transcript_50742/m.142067 type:complete len:244 (+) Transcript_50742:638-1369(+)
MLPTKLESSDGDSITGVFFAILGKFMKALPGKCHICFFHASCIFRRATSSTSLLVLIATSSSRFITCWQKSSVRSCTASIVQHSLCNCKGSSPACTTTASAPALMNWAWVWRTRLCARAIERTELSADTDAFPLASSGTIRRTMIIAALTFLLIFPRHSIAEFITVQPTWTRITAFAFAGHGLVRKKPGEKCAQLLTAMKPSCAKASVLSSGCNMTTQSDDAIDRSSEKVTSNNLSRISESSK